jgi:hypothetical protein
MEQDMRGHTILVPVIQAGFVIFARRGMAVTVRVREAQLSGAGVLLANAQRDMCVIWNGTASFSSARSPTGTSGIRNGRSGAGPNVGGQAESTLNADAMQRNDVRYS